MSKSRTLLSVGGYRPSYSNTLSDIFEVKTATPEDPVTLDVSTQTKKKEPEISMNTPPKPDPSHEKQDPEKIMKALLSDVSAYLDSFLQKITRLYQSRLLQIRKWDLD